MRAAFEDSRNNVPHRGEAGGEGEQIIQRFLLQHLPRRYSATNGFVIDRDDKVSGHTDIIVYDAYNCPVYRTSERGMILPNDNVASVIEVKFQLTTTTLDAAIDKLHELRNLTKTAFPPSPDGTPLGLKETYGVIFAFESDLKPETIMERWRSRLTDRNPLHQSLSLIVILDKGVFTTFVGMPGFGPAPAIIHGPSQHAAGTRVGVMYYDTGEMALDVFLRLLLAHLTFFRHRIDHPGFAFKGSDRVIAINFGEYVGTSEIRYYDPVKVNNVAKGQYVQRLQKAIYDLHRCASKHIESLPAHEMFHGQTIWRGIVEVFEVKDHSTATRCYAWSSLLEHGGEQEQFFAVLQVPPVASAEDAVRAAISRDFDFKPEPGKTYKVMSVALENGQNLLIEADLQFAAGKAFMILEWSSTDIGDVPKVRVEIEPRYLQRSGSPGIDFFYRGQIPIPAVQEAQT